MSQPPFVVISYQRAAYCVILYTAINYISYDSEDTEVITDFKSVPFSVICCHLFFIWPSVREKYPEFTMQIKLFDIY